ncbi:MAG: ABC transporter ATP-binding protein [Desulfopila sp.]
MLDIHGIDVYYGDVQALDEISIAVPKGAIVALVGANGAGKSTLLQAIAGLNRPTRGEIVFNGQTIGASSPETVVNMGIAFVPEGRGLFANLTVMENLLLGAYPARARAHSKESLARAFDLFPVLSDRTNQKAGSLSGGEQQMLAIGRALMAMPDLLMLDEPSLGLSPLVVKEIFALIATLNEQQTTILLVEQNIHQALRIADRAYVLKTGRIVMAGGGQELLVNPEVQKAYIGERWSKRC